MNTINKYLNEEKLPFSKKDIEKGLKFFMSLTEKDDVVKITDWDNRNVELWEVGSNKKTWYPLKQAANKLFLYIQ